MYMVNKKPEMYCVSNVIEQHKRIGDANVNVVGFFNTICLRFLLLILENLIL